MITKVGEKFKCKKYMESRLYLVGKIYKSEEDNCITGESGRKHHPWSSREKVLEYFDLIEDFKIQPGEQFICIKDVFMNNNPNDIRYEAGMFYKSEIKNCITDKIGNKEHYWSGAMTEDENDGFSTYFKKAVSKRKTEETIPETNPEELKLIDEFLNSVNYLYNNSEVTAVTRDSTLNISLNLWNSKVANTTLMKKMLLEYAKERVKLNMLNNF